MYQNRYPYFNYQNRQSSMYQPPYRNGMQGFINKGIPFTIPRGNITRSIFPSLSSIATKGTFSKVLTSTENIIATVNQVIPLYQQVSPMFKNSKILKSLTGKIFRKNNNSTEIIDDPEVVDNSSYKTKTNPEFNEETEPNKPFFG